MTTPKTAGYGSWKSPISSGRVASGGIRFERPRVLDGDNIYWVESRPVEGGRSVIVRWSPPAGTVDMTSPAFNARTMVHEYGGGAFTVKSGTVYFSNFADQRLYRKELAFGPLDSEPLPISPHLLPSLPVYARNPLICHSEIRRTSSGHSSWLAYHRKRRRLLS